MAYDNETYLQSLGQSRADVDRQVQNTYAEIERQRMAAHGQVDKARAAIPGVFDQSRGAFSGDTGSLQGSLSQFVGGPQSGLLSQGLGAITGSLGRQQTSFGKAHNLMAQGFDEQGTQRRGQAGNISKQLYADLDAKRADYISRREAEDRQAAFQEQQAAQARAHASALAQQQIAAQQAGLASQAQQAQLQREWEAAQGDQNRMHQFMLQHPELFNQQPPQQAQPRPLRGPY